MPNLNLLTRWRDVREAQFSWRDSPGMITYRSTVEPLWFFE
jgi:hypothetical protein